MHQRARLAQRRHPEQGEVSAYCFYAMRLRFGDLAFDVGANHGVHAVQMVRRGARVIAIEPQPALAEQLAATLDAVVIATAVGDEQGEATLYIPNESDDLASLDGGWADKCEIPLSWKDTIQVPVTTLDALIVKHGPPIFLKVDTEGFEHRVFAGLSNPVKHVLFEVHAALPDVAAEALRHLQRLGDYTFSVSPLNRWRFSPTTAAELLADLPVAADVYARL
jgi:FkbM family methyltransferase